MIQSDFRRQIGYSVFFDPSFVFWREQAWGLEAKGFEYVSEGRNPGRLRSILFFDRRGRLQQPPLDPYLSVLFESEALLGSPRRERQWLDVATKFATDLQRLKFHGSVNLPPGLMDARPFAQSGLLPAPKYTYLGEVPVASSTIEQAVRKRISKSLRAGYRFGLDVAAEDLADVLDRTGKRQGFTYKLTAEKLKMLEEMVAPSVYRKHVVRSAQGLIVSAGARLVTEGGVALDWIQGTREEALPDGAVQLMYRGVLDDMAELGAELFDFGGANIPAVARAKSSWGLPLVPYVQISRNTIRRFVIQSPRLRKAVSLVRRR